MKIVLGTVTVAVGLVLLMVGWSVGGKLMTAKDDWAVLQGVIVRALLVGVILSGFWYSFKKIRSLGTPEEPEEPEKVVEQKKAKGCGH